MLGKAVISGEETEMTDTDEIAALKREIAELRQETCLLQDKNEIRELQFKYGYYLDKCLYDEVVDLFAEDGVATFLNGVYRSKASIRRLMCGWFRELFTQGHNGPVYGFFLDHLLLQDIITVAPDRQTAEGRFRCLMLAGTHESRPEIPGMPRACWEAGIYEHAYVRENGVWKISVYDYSLLWQADYAQGWSVGGALLPPLEKTWPEDPNGPDELLSSTPRVWPETRVVPFHYPHPVTGERWNGDPIGKLPMGMKKS
jgi:hypothetical protein